MRTRRTGTWSWSSSFLASASAFALRSHSSRLQVLHLERLRVLLGLRRVERDAVEQRLRLVVEAPVLHAHLLHRLLVDVVAHDLLGDALVVGRGRQHAPAPELREPPDRVLG